MTELTDAHRASLHRAAITDEVIERGGIYSTSDGAAIVFPWRDGATEVLNVRPDDPGDGPKYIWPKGQTSILNHARVVDGSDRVLVVEGQKQHLAAASHAPAEWSVIGMNGCDGITARTYLGWAEGRHVLVALDADRDGNPKVAAAGSRVAGHLRDAGAASVGFLDVPAIGTDGLDDVLGKIMPEHRGPELARWIAAASGEGRESPGSKSGRHLRVARASEIKAAATRWLWLDGVARWLALGGLSLLAGREGVGKTTIAYGIAARVTLGTLPGAFYGTPRSVVIAATEDAWAQTVVPRLMACGADLRRVFRVDAMSAEGFAGALQLPADTAELERLCRTEEVALLLLDPLMSVLDGKLDSYKDADVRRALEPLSRLAHEAHVTMLGLIHVNKSQSTDLLNTLMASRAFAAVARGVLFALRAESGDDPAVEAYEFGQAKNNLGPKVPYSIRYTITGVTVGHDDELNEPIYGSRIVWGDQLDGSIETRAREQEAQASGSPRTTKTDQAVAWLVDYLTEHGPTLRRVVIAAAPFTERMINTARKRAGVKSENTESDATGGVMWSLEREPHRPNRPNEPNRPNRPSPGQGGSNDLGQPKDGSDGSDGADGSTGGGSSRPNRGRRDAQNDVGAGQPVRTCSECGKAAGWLEPDGRCLSCNAVEPTYLGESDFAPSPKPAPEKPTSAPPKGWNPPVKSAATAAAETKAAEQAAAKRRKLGSLGRPADPGATTPPRPEPESEPGPDASRSPQPLPEPVEKPEPPTSEPEPADPLARVECSTCSTSITRRIADKFDGLCRSCWKKANAS